MQGIKLSVALVMCALLAAWSCSEREAESTDGGAGAAGGAGGAGGNDCYGGEGGVGGDPLPEFWWTIRASCTDDTPDTPDDIRCGSLTTAEPERFQATIESARELWTDFEYEGPGTVAVLTAERLEIELNDDQTLIVNGPGVRGAATEVGAVVQVSAGYESGWFPNEWYKVKAADDRLLLAWASLSGLPYQGTTRVLNYPDHLLPEIGFGYESLCTLQLYPGAGDYAQCIEHHPKISVLLSDGQANLYVPLSERGMGQREVPNGIWSFTADGYFIPGAHTCGLDHPSGGFSFTGIRRRSE